MKLQECTPKTCKNGHCIGESECKCNKGYMGKLCQEGNVLLYSKQMLRLLLSIKSNDYPLFSIFVLTQSF